MGVKRSPRNNNSNSYNNFYDGGLIIQNYVSKTLNPTYIKPIFSCRTKDEDGINDDSNGKRKRSKPPPTAIIRKSPRLEAQNTKNKIKVEDVVETTAVDVNRRKRSTKVKVQDQKISKKLTTKSKEPEPALETETNERVLISSVDKFVGEMKGLTCKEVKIFLEKNPNMTVDEKITFIEQNSKNHRDLRSWLKSQHWSVKELTYYFRTQQFIQTKLAEGIENGVNYFSDSADDKDPDCIEVTKILEELKSQQKTEEWRAMAIDYLKRAANALWSGVVGAVTMIYSATKHIFSLLYSYGIEIYRWIAKDPKMAKYTLITLKIMKKRMCRFVGHHMRSNNYIDINELRNNVYKYKIENNLLVDNESDKINVLDETTRDIFSEAAKKTMVNTLKEMAEPVGTFVGGAVISFLGIASAPVALAGGALLGVVGLAGGLGGDKGDKGTGMFEKLSSLIGTCVTKVVTFGMEETADAAEDAIEVALYVKNSNTCFSLLLELVDPRNCMQDMLKGYLRAEDSIKMI